MKKATRKKPEHVADQIEKDLAAAALSKRKAGEKPTARELAALRKIEKQREEDLRWQYYSSIPKRHWQEMSGRSAKVLNEQADRYNLPLRGRTIDLAALAKAFHDFLATNKYILTAGEKDADPLLNGSDSPGLERYRQAKAQLAELDLAERRSNLISVELFRRTTEAALLPLRRFAEEQIKEHGNGTADAWADAVEEFSREIQGVIGQSIDGDGT